MPLMNDDRANVGALVMHADTHFSARRMTEAATGYRQVLSMRPRDAHALHRMSLVSVHLDELDEARAYAKQALQVAPQRADWWEIAGLLASLKRDYQSAEAFYRQAITITGHTASLHRNLADCLRACGRVDEAIGHYQQSLKIEPRSHHANRALARINAELGHIDQAVDFWMRTWMLQPAASQEDLDEIVAITATGHAASFDETIDWIRTHFAAGTAALKAVTYVLNRHYRYEDALAVARQAMAIDPHDAILCHNAAWALGKLGRVTECRPYSEMAARMAPDDPALQYHFAGVLLCLGEFEEGWKRNKSFYDVPANRALMAWPDFPAWHGEAVPGRQFLLIGEQGLGDQIQFLRFAQWLHQQGAIVDVLVDMPIAVLAATMTGVRTIFTTLPPGPYDYWCHMFSVPGHMKLDLPMLPVAMPYLAAAPEKVRYWRARIDALSAKRESSGTRRVGIVYAGSPTQYLDRFRSVQFDTLKALFALPDISWYSLQKGDREREPEALAQQLDIHTLGPAIHDFADTLAILHSLDLLITVDTSVAHLAGAAGLPVWVLIPAYTDWRWMTERTDSPWYPSMRLFRQRELGEWGPVIEEVRDALRVASDTDMR